MTEQRYLDNLESRIVHHPVRGKQSFLESWEFVMLIAVVALLFGFLLGLGLTFVL